MSMDFLKELPPIESEFPPEVMYPAPVEIEASPSAPLHRLTVVERVYHRQGNNPPVQIESRFEQPLEVDQPCYFRPACRVSGEWLPLEFGWLSREDVGTLVIQNISGKYLATIPTPEAKQELDRKVLILAASYQGISKFEFAHVPPKQNLRLVLVPGVDYLVRSQSGQAEFNLYAIPR